METPIKTIVTMYMLYPSLLPVRRAAAAIGRSWRVGVYVAPHALAIATAALRRRIPTPTHVDRHLSGSAALVRLSRRPKPFLHPLPPHVGVGFRHTQIAGWGRASGRRRFYPVAHLDVEGSGQRAASRTPARAVASRGKGRVAPPRATDQQLVGVGQGVCGLPGRREGIRLSSETWTRRREGMGRQHSARGMHGERARL